jgi:MerR family mercuric resistance operon transcriptional regulator
LPRLQEFTIGRLSSESGVGIETIRFYEKAGLLPKPPRTHGGHRLYTNEQLKRLLFVRRSRELGFSMEEIRNLLGLVDRGYTCGQVKLATLEHLQAIRLRKMERTLADTAARCKGGPAPECPIVEVLSRQA